MTSLLPASGVAKGGRGGATAPPIAKKTFSEKGLIRREIWWGGGGGGYTLQSSKLKLIKYVSTEGNDDILEELDL